MPLSVSTIVSEHAGFVWRALMNLGVREANLEDLSQEVFLVVMRRLRDFEGRSSLRTWLYGICRNVASEARRRERSRPEVLSAELPETVVGPAQDGVVWVKQAHQQLIVALDTLEEHPRLVFILFELEDVAMDEIAEATATPLRTCYAHLDAAREHVHAALRHPKVARSSRQKVSS